MKINQLNTKLYRAIDVWKQYDTNTIVIFRCFEIIGEGKFMVQSADFMTCNTMNSDIRLFEKQKIELFIEQPPENRSGVYPSLEEAIIAHNKEFFNL